MRVLMILAVSLACGLCWAGVLPDAQRQEMIAFALKNFWGRAKLSNGEFVQPSSEAERQAVPISNALANRTIDVGEVSGMAAWCKLDWRPMYMSLTQSARNSGLDEKQVAFISVLHGVVAGNVSNGMSKSAACSDQQRLRVQKLLEQSRERGLDGANKG